MPINNTVYAFELVSPGVTKVTVATAHGLSNGDVVEIMNSSAYLGTWAVSNVDAFSFRISAAYVTNEQGCKWQISRARPVIVNVTGETIDTLRQAVNQISNDVGNKYELDAGIADRRTLVKAINSLVVDKSILDLITSIAVN